MYGEEFRSIVLLWVVGNGWRFLRFKNFCALANSDIYFYCAGSKHATVEVYSWLGCVRFGCDRFLNSIKFRTITCTERNQNNPA